MLQNAYLLAKIGADTAENEQHLPKICQKLATTLRVRPRQELREVVAATVGASAAVLAVKDAVLRAALRFPKCLRRGEEVKKSKFGEHE